jgi:phenylalanyl-tRNA synthetase beta chain
MTPTDQYSDIYASALSIATRSGKQIGTLGVIAKDLAARLEIKATVFFAEFDWDVVTALAAKHSTTFSPLPKTQSVKRDLSLLIDKTVSMADIEAVVAKSDRKLLRGVSLFDVYEGKGLPEGKKSYAISITLHDDEKTLNDKAVDAVMAKIIANLKKQLGAELR